jgi:hypothetical protein
VRRTRSAPALGMMIATVNALTATAKQLGTGRTVTVDAAWLWSTDSVTHGERPFAGVEFSVVTALVIVVISLIAARAWRYRPVWLRRRLTASRASDR